MSILDDVIKNGTYSPSINISKTNVIRINTTNGQPIKYRDQPIFLEVLKLECCIKSVVLYGCERIGRIGRSPRRPMLLLGAMGNIFDMILTNYLFF